MPLLLSLLPMLTAIASDPISASAVLPPALEQQSLPEAEIVVVGRRLEQARYAMTLHRETGAARCWITVSTGDRSLDQSLCAAAEECAQLGNSQLVQSCMRVRKRELLEQYAAR